MEIEVARVVDDHRVVRTERKRQARSSACEQESVTTIWSKSAITPRSARRTEKSRRSGAWPSGSSYWRRLAKSARAASRIARWTPRSSTQESGSQPAPGQRKSGAPVIACRLIHDGSTAGSGGGSAAANVSGLSGAGDEEPGAAPGDDRPFGREPVVSLDDRRFRDIELGGELAHRGKPRAARQRATRYAAANERRQWSRRGKWADRP